MNKQLKNKAAGDSFAATELHDLSLAPRYQHWITVAQLYAASLGTIRPRTGQPAPRRTLTLCVESSDQESIDQTLEAAYYALDAYDTLVVDFAPDQARELSVARDLVGRALFKAGFDCPAIWAGRKILEAENTGLVFGALLPSSALGAGPRMVAGVTVAGVTVAGVNEPLLPDPEQMVAIARRSAHLPPNDRKLLLSIILPVYNEKQTFRQIIELLLAKTVPGYEIEICIVESNSTDGTRDDVLAYSSHPRVRLLLEDKPSGKGHAVRKGLAIATGDIVLIQDADLEYDPADYEKLLDPIAKLQTSFVLGSRHVAGERSWQIREFTDRRSVSQMMNLGHLFFTWLVNTLYGVHLRDPFTMYKVFRRDCIHNIRFECNRFDFDPELVGKLIRNGFRPLEIDVHYQSRSFDDGKKVEFFRDPPTWIRACFRHRFSNLHVWP